MLTLTLLLLAPGCRDDGKEDAAGVPAVYDPSRSEHYFDQPFPSDALADVEGRPDLSGFPTSEVPITADLVGGWAARLEQTAQGFGNNSAAYFRFEAPLDLPTSTDGAPDDPVLLVGLDTPELLPLELRFIEDPGSDPFYGANTLAMAPALGHPPRPGERYAAVVMTAAGAASPDDYAPPDGVADALAAVGVDGAVAIATTFTVQDTTGQLRALFDDADSRLPDWGGVAFKRVVRLTYSQGLTASGQDATIATAAFEDGTSNAAFLAPLGAVGEHEVDLLEWPMAVYEAQVPTLNYQGLDDRPYMSPGITHITDVDLFTGWIDFHAGAPARAPEAETMRVVVSLPLGEDGQPIQDAPVVMYDHGTGGHAYHSVQRRNLNDDGLGIAEALAEAGVGIIGRDASLYGTRYPLIDEGFGASLGYYNIVNLPAFRDNERQTAVDGHLLLRFIQDGLNDRLPAGSVAPDRVLRLGHSLGSVTTNLGVSAEPEAFESVLLSGSGGVFALYFLDTGLLGSIDTSLLDTLFALVDADPPDEITPATALGALLGLDEEDWAHVDRLHPVMTLFQWTMDPGDPMSVARDQSAPSTVFIGVGDYQVPNPTSEGLSVALPDPTVLYCEASYDYDPHYCLYREPEGVDAVRAWLP